MGWAGRTSPLAPSLPPYWGYIMEPVLRPQVGSAAALRARINNAAASVTAQTLENTWREIEYHLDTLRATNGAHIQMY
jgi:hypothetical protein